MTAKETEKKAQNNAKNKIVIMGTTSKQVMDIKTSKGLSQTSNEELRAWTDKG